MEVGLFVLEKNFLSPKTDENCSYMQGSISGNLTKAGRINLGIKVVAASNFLVQVNLRRISQSHIGK
jgi:hypothetical protein